MHNNTKVTHREKGEKGVLPLDSKFGFAASIKANENCLVIIPSPEDKHGIIVPDSVLKKLGYFYVDKTIVSKFSSLLDTLQNS